MTVALRNYFTNFSGVGAGSHFPDPFYDLASLAVPQHFRNVLYWCLVPGTPIELADFSIRSIEHVRVGDRVLTRGRTHERVVKTSVRTVDEEIVRLEFSGFGSTLPLRLTAQHKVWRVSTAKLKPSRVAASVSFADAEKVEADKVRAGDYFVTPLPLRGRTRQHRFSGWLAGMYAAGGCPMTADDRHLGSRFTLGADDEVSGVLAELVRRATQETGAEQTSYVPPGRPDVRLVTVNDVELSDWLRAHVPGSAKTKRLTSRVLDYSDEFLLGLIGGFIDGGGNVASHAGVFRGAVARSASYELLYQLQRIAYLVGLTPSLCQVAGDRGFAPEGSAGYALSFGKCDAQRLVAYSVKLRRAREAFADFEIEANGKRKDTFLCDGYVFHRVRRATREVYKGPVHNFEVENDHSYVAGGVVVSNCEYIFSMFGTYRTAMERVISHFVTDIEILNASEDETKKWKNFMDNLGVVGFLKRMLRDTACYGNGFASVVVPFVRWLSCPKCGFAAPLREVHNVKHKRAFNFEWQMPNFVATCPSCKSGSGYRGPWRVDDKEDDEEGKIRLKVWSPHEIETLHCPYSDDVAYLWRIPEDYKQTIRRGHLFHLERVDKPVLEAIHNNHVFRFNPDAIFHMKEPTLGGQVNRGWGIPRILTNFRQIFLIQVLRRQIEAVCMDYVVPFRVITPAPPQGTTGGHGGLPTDPLLMYSGHDFRGQVNAMIRRRRRDPCGLQVLGFPVNFQMFGAEATKLVPTDLMTQSVEQLLNDAGVPVELYSGSLQLQTAPVALRLFESTWHHLVHDMNMLLRWLVRQVSQIFSWEAVNATMKRVTIADDLEKQMMAAQLMMSQQLSRTTVLRDLGNYDWRQEQRQIAEEAQYEAEMQARVQEEMQQAGFAQQIAKGQMAAGGQPAQPAQPGQPAAGGQPAQGDPAALGGAMGTSMQGPVTDYIASMGPNTPVSPEDMLAVAESIAQDLLGRPESVKDSELRKLKQYNEALHGLVRARMDQIRRDTKAQAGNAAMAQFQQPAA